MPVTKAEKCFIVPQSQGLGAFKTHPATMPTIKFTYPYRKLLNEPQKVGERAKLLQIVETDFSDLTAEFLEYDTDAGKYELPVSGPCIILLFQKRTAVPNLFTTVRAATPEKLQYYKSLIGEIVDLQITIK